MFAQQLESRLVMIKGNLFPTIRDMAFATIRPELAVMGVIPGVAGRTINRCTSAQQLESRLVMVKGNLFPIIRDMAFAAISSELAVMGVILGVAS